MASSIASSVPRSAPHEPSPPLRVSAAQLYAEYDRNAVAANDEFAGRTLEVSGKILSAAHASGGMTHLRIAVDQYGLNDIEAQIAEASDAPLKKGQPVTLLCTQLSRAQGSLALDRCSVAPAD